MLAKGPEYSACRYSVFAEANKELLRTILPPAVAVNYYKNEDLYMVSPQHAPAAVPGT